MIWNLIVRYGGFGYGNLFENYLDKIKSSKILSDDELENIFSLNILNLLLWWKEPVFEIKSTKTITCYLYIFVINIVVRKFNQKRMIILKNLNLFTVLLNAWICTKQRISINNWSIIININIALNKLYTIIDIKQ